MTRPSFKRLVIERRAAEEAACAEVDAADLSWAGAYIARGLADAEAGRTVPADIVHAELRARFGTKRG
jgi:predicted transcriptional regulator